MAEAPEAQQDPQRERPVHWGHPVDERRREARARRHRRRRIVLLVLVLVVAAAGGAYFYLTSDERVEQFAEAYLENLLGTHVGIGRAVFTLGEGLVLENITVTPPPPFKDAMLSAARVDLKIDPMSLLRLSPEVTEMVVSRPRINLELWDEELWNFQALARLRPAAAAAHARPVVALNDGIVRIARRIAGETVYEHQMKVNGLLLPSETDRHMFRFQTDVRSQEVHLAVASGLLDSRTGRLQFEGQASNVALSQDLYSTLPSEVQRIWDRFEPTGSVNLKVLFDEQQGFRLVTELTGVGFAYTYGGLRHEFENLTGRCTFSPTTLGLKGVQGLMNGWPVALDGDVSGFDRDRLSMDLAVTGKQIDFEKSRLLLVSLAPHMETIFDAYSPKGQADVDLKIRRGSETSAALDVSGVLFCRDMEMTYRQFPYRVTGMRGTVRFSSAGYETEGVEGYHGQAKVTVTGWAKNPGPLYESRVAVHARRVPLDEDLRSALTETQRRVYDQYSPAGIADIDIEVYRPPREKAPLETVVTINFLDGDVEYREFPYRLHHTTGKVVISPGKTEIVEVEGRHGDAVVRLSGAMASEEGGQQVLHLKVAGTDVALDEDLDKALPERERGILRVFHLSGLADIEGTITRGPETQGKLDYDLAIRLKGARMIYEPFPFLAEEVRGDLRLARGSCRIESLTGFNSGARIDASGWIDQRPDDYAMDLVLTGKDVTLGEALRGALGPEMRTVWSHLSPRGQVDIDAHLTKALGEGEAMKHRVLVTMRDAQATLDVFPYPLQHVTGRMEFQGGEVLLHDIRARSGLTEFLLGGRIAYGERGPELDLTIQTKGLRFEGPLRDALPEPLKKAFAILRPTGRIDLNLESLVYRHTDENGSEAVWRGSAVLDEVGLEPGLKVAGVVGTAEMQGHWRDGKVALDGTMHIQQGKVADKDVTNTRLRIEKSEDSNVAGIRNFEGEFYGGRVEGFATIGLDPGGKYAFNLAATDVDFERLLRDGFRLEHNIRGGRLRGTLGLRAGGTDAKAVEASGYAYVTEANLYETPLVVRVLNILRLAPPERTAFQKARVLYFLRGKRLILGDLRLEGRAMNLYGAGTMESDGRLNLMFLTGQKDDDPLIPAFEELLEGVRKQIVVVLVTGTLAEPQVEMRSLSAVTAPIREILQLVREQRERERQGPKR